MAGEGSRDLKPPPPPDHRLWHRIDRLFQLAIDLGPEERERMLELECGGDLELRRRVESLLRIDAGEVPFLDRLPAAGDEDHGVELDQPSLGPGDRVGLYRLGERLGEGGTGVVFAAERDDGHLERRVAVKLLKRARPGPQAVARFRGEGWILARLEHPNIAGIYDAGVTDGGVPYLVMERVEGRPIDRFCNEARLAIGPRIELFLSVLDAVAFAHRHLVVHRDLKPGNVLVRDDGVPKLLDFGIAKLLEPPPDLASLTHTAFQPMTPQYASPEQLAGEPVTTASDVYALGLLLYELLTGAPPYRLDGASPASVARLLDGTLPIRRPSAAAREIRPDLDRVVLKALAVRPEERYRSVEQLADDLRRYLGGFPVLAHGPSRLYRARRFVARHRLSVTGGAAAALLLLALTASLTVAVGALGRERDRARAEAATAEQVGSFLAGLFEAAGPAVSRGQEVTARDLLDLGAGRLEREDGQRPEVRAGIAALIGEAYLELSRLAEARPLIEESLRLRRQALDPGDPRIADGLDLLSALEHRASAFERSEAAASEAVALRRRAGAPPEVLAGSLLRLGTARMQRGDVGGAEQPLAEALELADTAGERAGLLRGRILADLGGIAGRRGEWTRAEELTREAVELLSAALGLDHPEVLEARRDLATFVGFGPGGGERVGELLGQLLEDQRRVFEPNHEQVLMTAITLAAHHADRVEYEQSRRLYEDALPALEARFGGDHYLVGAALIGLGHVLDRTGDLDGAECALRRGLAIYRLRLAPDAGEQAHPLRLLAEVLRRKGDPRGAEEAAREAVAILERTAPGDTWFLPISRAILGRALADRGRFDEAEPLLASACETLGATHPADDATVKTLRETLDQLYRDWGRPVPEPGTLACWPAPGAVSN
jgi:serine/threonine-protein kinase